MATNYTAAGSYNDMLLRLTSPEQAQRLDEYKRMYELSYQQGNKAGMEAAHQAAEALRATMGYSGGADGSDFIPLSTGTASGYTQPYTYSSYDDYFAGTGYGSLEQGARDAADAQVAMAVSGYEANKKTVAQDADELARQAYIAYMRGMDALPQQMSAMGYNGGLSETQQVVMNTGYQDRHNQINLQKQSKLAALDTAIAEARARGQSGLAAQLTDLRSQSLSQWNSYVQQQNNAARDDYWKTVNNAQSSYQWLRQLENTNNWKQQELDYKKEQGVKEQSWQETLFEYQKQQDLLEQQLQQQKLLLERMKLYA